MPASPAALRCLRFVLLAMTPSVMAGRAAIAQTPTNGEPPTVRAHYLEQGVRIDGMLREVAWAEAIPAREFVQGEPVENAPADQPTEVRVLYDQSAIYIGARMHDRHPSQIGHQLVRRDERGAYDYFEVSLDSNNDRRTGYRFRVSAAGVQRDVYLYDDVREDQAWDAVWQSAVHLDSAGWEAEIRIPLSQIKYNAADSVQSWGVNFARRRITSNELTYFALESRVRHGKVSVFGRLQGLRLPSSARRMEMRPYALASVHTAPSDPDDPFFDGSEMDQRIGGDLRYGLGANYTLDATVNPDFGQVEVDPAVINLTAFETFFPEKRPFFVEDAQVFDFGLAGRRNELFYSRRIGRQPRGFAPEDAAFEQIPDETTILGAAKLTGRTAGGLSIGGLAAITAQEKGVAYDSANDITSRFIVEPPSQYGALRAQQDYRAGASQVGAILTAAHRNLPSGGGFDYLTSSAFSLGLDFEHNWGGANSRNWVLFGHFAASHVRGSNEALIELQTASNHYFQRPDATRFSVDSGATSMTGHTWQVQLERQSARHWTGAVWLGEISPGFEANDLGFMQSSERLDAGARLGYHEITPGSLFRSYSVTVLTFQNWRHEALDDIASWRSWDRAHKHGSLNLRSGFEFLNYWNLDLDAELEPQTLSDSKTRGGPLMIDPGSHRITASLATDRRSRVFLEPRLEYEDRHRGGYRWDTRLEVNLRPSPSLEIRLEPAFRRERDPAQYVTTEDDLTFVPTFGRRYIFSDLIRRQFSLETRLDIAFSPQLTLQFFAQPLVSAGDYLTYKQLKSSESFDFDVFEEGDAVVIDDEVACVGGRTCISGDDRYIDFNGDGRVDASLSDEDFNVRSLRLNAVLRWEYRPGSTIYFVWQQKRHDRVNNGEFDFGGDVQAIGDVEPENVFIVKLTYWLGL